MKRKLAVLLSGILVLQTAVPVAAAELLQPETVIVQDQDETQEEIKEESPETENPEGGEMETDDMSSDERMEPAASDEQLDDDEEMKEEPEAVAESEETDVANEYDIIEVPQIQSVTSWGYQALKITWNDKLTVWDPSIRPEGYQLFRKNASGGKSFVVETKELSYVEQGLITGKIYTYYVRPYWLTQKGRMYGTFSDAKSGKPIPKKAVITSVTAKAKQNTVKWNRVSGASGYRIYYRIGTEKWKYLKEVGSSTVSYVHKNVTENRTYGYRVRAFRTVNKKPIYGWLSDIKSVKVPIWHFIAQLPRDKTTGKYDVTGDGKADSFRYAYSRDSGEARVYLNGKYIQKVFMARGGAFYVCRFSEKRVILINAFSQYGGSTCEAYRYQNGKFKVVNSSLYFDQLTLSHVGEIKMSASGRISIDSSEPKFWNMQSFDLASDYSNDASGFSCRGIYKYANGRLVLTSREEQVTSDATYTAQTSFYTSSNRECDDYSGVRVGRGDRVKLLKIYFPADTQRSLIYQISVNGWTGWFEDSEDKLLW